MKKFFLLAIGLTTTLMATAQSMNAQLRNDCFWDTADGMPIYSQGGGIFKFKDADTGQDAYFWYGCHYREAETYRQNPSVTPQGNTVVGVSCYKSTDLLHWHDMGHVLTAETISGGRGWVGWFGRLGVAYIEETGQYALLAQHNSAVMVALSDSPTGPFTVHKHIDMKPMIGTPNTGDQTVFTDEDTGKDYLIYSYGKGRHIGYISEIGVLDDGSIGLKDCVQVFKGEGREGNCMFKYKGKYYLCASNLYGWDASFAYYLVSDNIYGPYTPTNKMQIMDGCERDYAHITQTGFFYTLRGTEQETVIYCGDRWSDFAGNGLGYNQWVPLSFDGDRPHFNSLSEWNLDPVTGRWTVGQGNNYVMNSSFEADRRIVPIPVKPRQEHLLGWETKVIKGNEVSLNNPHSPHLNYNNTQEDRLHVTGEKSLCINDSIAFEREVSQRISSSPFVVLEDGTYKLTLMYRANELFKEIDISISSAGKKQALHLNDLQMDNHWHQAQMLVTIRKGEALLTFHAKGNPMAQCLIDDVSLVKELRMASTSIQQRERFEFQRNLPIYADSLIADLTYPLAWENSGIRKFSKWKKVTTDEQMSFKYDRTENGGFANCIPALRRWLDYPHIASLSCPNAMLFINGTQDKLFPVAGVKKAFDIMHKTWKSRGVDEKLETELWDMPHSCPKKAQERALAFFQKHLQ